MRHPKEIKNIGKEVEKDDKRILIPPENRNLIKPVSNLNPYVSRIQKRKL